MYVLQDYNLCTRESEHIKTWKMSHTLYLAGRGQQLPETPKMPYILNSGPLNQESETTKLELGHIFTHWPISVCLYTSVSYIPLLLKAQRVRITNKQLFSMYSTKPMAMI